MAKPSLGLDPALLALRLLDSDEDKLAEHIECIKTLATALRSEKGYSIYLLADVATRLASLGMYPAQPVIEQALVNANLKHVYSVEDIRRAINEVISKAGDISVISGVEFMIPTVFTLNPAAPGIHTGILEEALQLTFLHAAFATRLLGNSFMQLLLADALKRQLFLLHASIDCIDPPVEPEGGKIDDFSSDVWTAASVEDFVSSLAGEDLWRHAKTKDEFAYAIRQAAFRIRVEQGCPNPEANCRAFTLGERFAETLRDKEAAGNGRFASNTLETCARIVAQLPKRECNRFYKRGANGRDQDVTREKDSAEAWRTHISSEREGMRLMYWERRDEVIEFANIGPKNELEIH